MKNLLSKSKLGAYEIPNRIIMAPLTRGRADENGNATEIMTQYYEQRADAGLIISEATSISVQGSGWIYAPGVYTEQQVAAWKQVTQAIHKKGGRIFLQLWHMGRVSHPDFQEGASLPVAPSPIAAQGESRTPKGKKPYVVPRELSKSEMNRVVKDYVKAAVGAMTAGFDGVEVHGANGYLLDQFVRDASNQRTDDYGGSIAKRWRFPLEVVQALIEAIGAEKIGYRISPTGTYNSMSDRDPTSTFAYGARELANLGIAYLHVLEALPGNMFHNAEAPLVLPRIRKEFTGFLIANGGYTPEKAEKAILEQEVDAIAFGSLFLANPDFVQRVKRGVAEFNEVDFPTMYSTGKKGYTDYPYYSN